MDSAKIRFSEEELALMNDARILLIKQSLLGKVDSVLGNVADHLQQSLHAPACSLPAELLTLGPKIARGENYQGLPYRMLDYPRSFSRKDIFAFRTFFWWGNYLSLSLHLRGRYLDEYALSCLHTLRTGASAHWRIALEGDEWDHDAIRYTSIRDLEMNEWEKRISQAQFCKLSLVLHWGNWEGIEERMKQAVDEIFGHWGCQLPKR